LGEREAEEVLKVFKEHAVNYKIFDHAPVYTSEEASRIRNVELKTGVKAMLVKTREGKFFLSDMAANRRIDFAKLEGITKSRHIRFATREEVLSVTNCEPGSVHPLGRLFGVETYLDNSVLENEFVNFNIGMLTRSVQIKSEDLLRLMKPDFQGDFSK